MLHRSHFICCILALVKAKFTILEQQRVSKRRTKEVWIREFLKKREQCGQTRSSLSNACLIACYQTSMRLDQVSSRAKSIADIPDSRNLCFHKLGMIAGHRRNLARAGKIETFYPRLSQTIGDIFSLVGNVWDVS